MIIRKNCLLKKEAGTVVHPLQRFEEACEYDVNGNELKYGTANNRLMKVVRTQFDTDPGSPAETATPVWTKYYFYSSDGNVLEDEGTVERIVTELPNSNRYSAIRFGYANNGRTVTHVLGEAWNWNGLAGGANAPSDYTVTFARQFRYDGARQRYLSRTFDLQVLNDTGAFVTDTDTWSDYDGTSIYNGFGFGVLGGRRSYEPGLAITCTPALSARPWPRATRTARAYSM